LSHQIFDWMLSAILAPHVPIAGADIGFGSPNESRKDVIGRLCLVLRFYCFKKYILPGENNHRYHYYHQHLKR